MKQTDGKLLKMVDDGTFWPAVEGGDIVLPTDHFRIVNVQNSGWMNRVRFTVAFGPAGNSGLMKNMRMASMEEIRKNSGQFWFVKRSAGKSGGLMPTICWVPDELEQAEFAQGSVCLTDPANLTFGNGTSLFYDPTQKSQESSGAAAPVSSEVVISAYFGDSVTEKLQAQIDLGPNGPCSTFFENNSFMVRFATVDSLEERQRTNSVVRATEVLEYLDSHNVQMAIKKMHRNVEVPPASSIQDAAAAEVPSAAQ